MEIFTRQQYHQAENKAEAHRKYYSQYATPAVRAMAKGFVAEAKQSKDPHFNDIPLSRWDHASDLLRTDIAAVNKKLGNGYTWCVSDGVCALKEAVRELIEEEALCAH